MKFKEFIRRTLFYLSVPECVSCREKLDVNDAALCGRCLDKFVIHKERTCSVCFNTYDKCVCVNEVLRKGGVKRLIKCYRYVTYEDTLPSNSLIYSLKRDNRRDVLSFLSKELSVAIRNGIAVYEDYFITNVPRRKRSIIKYGFDHTTLLAKAVAKELNIPYVKTLKSLAKHSQKKLSHKQRGENARFKAISKKRVENNRFIIIDDVVTTGASMVSSAKSLKSFGAKSVVGATIAIAYPDNN